MKNTELEQWINKRILGVRTLEKELKYKLDFLMIDEQDLQWLLEDAREEERKKYEDELDKKYYFGYACGICWNCPYHNDYRDNSEEILRNRGFGVLKECKKCEKQKLLKRPFSELTEDDFEEEETIKKVV